MTKDASTGMDIDRHSRAKRKRHSPPASIKVVPPALSNSSPPLTKNEHSTKRPKISLRLKRDPGLSENIRTGLATVIKQMAAHLPSPIDNILTLYLPPDFTPNEENTLGHLLSHPLTWDHLVNTLHVFCRNLLVPCVYPNPMPSAAQFHVPVPPLPAHYPPHAIYTFCETLYSLLAQIGPERPRLSAERWGLLQKVPSAQGAGEWFTGAVDTRELKDSLQQLAETGDKFGYATAMAVQSTAGEARHVDLRDTLYHSRKSLRSNRLGGFGGRRTVQTIHPGTFQPSFGASFSSLNCSAGYYDTLDAMRRSNLQVSSESSGYYGMDRAKDADELIENEQLIEELQAWQDWRIRRGQELATEHEEALADELLDSLARLATTPRMLLPASPGLAHRLAQLLPSSSPSLRGTLDPRRPQALHDNLTVRPRPLSRAPGAHYAASPYGMSIGRGYGPSALRQSFGPGLQYK